jgi:anti-anti-sigma factor
MPIEIRPDRTLVVRLDNDPQFSPELEDVGRDPSPQPPAVVLDFGTVRHINSSGIARLLRLRKRLIEENGRLVLCGLSPQVTSVFQVTGLDKIFNFAQDSDNALRSNA